MFLLLIFILFIFYWFQGKRVWALVWLFIYLANGFGIRYISNTLINSYNVIFLFGNAILLIKLNSGELHKIWNTDKFAKFLLCTYIFLLLHCLVTIIGQWDSLKLATSVLRQTFAYFLLYFILKDVHPNEILSALKKIAIIIATLSICYALRYIGINIYEIPENQKAFADEITRIGIPNGLEFFTIFAIIFSAKRINVLPYLIPLLGGAMRGAIMSLIVGFAWIFRSKVKHIRTFIIMGGLCFIIYFIYINFFLEEFNRYDISFTQEIFSAIDSSVILDPSSFVQGDNFNFRENGTFSFRIALLAERIIYLFQHPQTLPFGTGMISEESASQYFYFILGTANDDLKYGYALITTNDILWPTYILRFGLMGIIFWILYFKKSYSCIKQTSNLPLAKVGMVYIIYLVFHSFGTDMPQRPYSIFLLFLIIIYCQKKTIH